jgi:hypothetical protein
MGNRFIILMENQENEWPTTIVDDIESVITHLKKPENKGARVFVIDTVKCSILDSKKLSEKLK